MHESHGTYVDDENAHNHDHDSDIDVAADDDLLASLPVEAEVLFIVACLLQLRERGNQAKV